MADFNMIAQLLKRQSARRAEKVKEEQGTTSTFPSSWLPIKHAKLEETGTTSKLLSPSFYEWTPGTKPKEKAETSKSSTSGRIPTKSTKRRKMEEAEKSPSTSEGTPIKRRRIKRRSGITKLEQGSQTNQPKPFKVCDVQRSRRVGVVARTLEELRAKVQERIPDLIKGFKVMLEDDCTQIENEEYFETLPKNSVIIALNSDQAMTDVTSPGSSGYVEVDGGVKDQSEEHLSRVAQRIARNPSVLAFLPKADLKVVIDADIHVLQVKLMDSRDNAVFIQDACERRLIDQIKSDEAQDLLKLYHRAKTESCKSKSPKKRRAKTK